MILLRLASGLIYDYQFTFLQVVHNGFCEVIGGVGVVLLLGYLEGSRAVAGFEYTAARNLGSAQDSWLELLLM